MRKLKLQVQLSVDGFIAGPGGQMDWLTFAWTDDIKQYVDELMRPVDTILLGRKLAEGFIQHWASIPDAPGADKINNAHKVVFTGTLAESVWNNTVLAKGQLVDEVDALKKEPGGDLIVYGGGTFVSSLIEAGLIDEYHLFVNPVALGKGMPIFAGLNAYQRLTLIQTKAFACGVVVLTYQAGPPK